MPRKWPVVAAVAEPTAHRHIVSKDAGFDPLIQHLKSKKVFAGRVKAIADISLVKSSNSNSPAEQEAVVLAKPQQLKSSKPRTIATLFQKQITEEEVASLVQSLTDQDLLSIAVTKGTYSLPSET